MLYVSKMIMKRLHFYILSKHSGIAVVHVEWTTCILKVGCSNPILGSHGSLPQAVIVFLSVIMCILPGPAWMYKRLSFVNLSLWYMYIKEFSPLKDHMSFLNSKVWTGTWWHLKMREIFSNGLKTISTSLPHLMSSVIVFNHTAVVKIIFFRISLYSFKI